LFADGNYIIGYEESESGKICVRLVSLNGSFISTPQCIDAEQLDIIVPSTTLSKEGYIITTINSDYVSVLSIFDSKTAKFTKEIPVKTKSGEIDFILYGIQYDWKENILYGVQFKLNSPLAFVFIDLDTGVVTPMINFTDITLMDVINSALDPISKTFISIHTNENHYTLCKTTLSPKVTQDCTVSMPKYTEILTFGDQKLFGENGWNITTIDYNSGKVIPIGSFNRFTYGASGSMNNDQLYLWIYETNFTTTFGIFDLKQLKLVYQVPFGGFFFGMQFVLSN